MYTITHVSLCRYHSLRIVSSYFRPFSKPSFELICSRDFVVFCFNV